MALSRFEADHLVEQYNKLYDLKSSAKRWELLSQSREDSTAINYYTKNLEHAQNAVQEQQGRIDDLEVKYGI